MPEVNLPEDLLPQQPIPVLKINEALTPIGENAIRRDLRRLNETRKETIVAMNFVDMVEKSTDLSKLCSSLKTLGLLDIAVVRLQADLLAKNKDQPLIKRYDTKSIKNCKFLLYAGDITMLDNIWSQRNEMDVFTLVNLLEPAAEGSLAAMLMQKMNEDDDTPIQLVNLLSHFKQQVVDAQSCWKYVQKLLNHKVREQLTPLIIRWLHKYVNTQTAPEIFDYAITNPSLKKERLQTILIACAQNGLHKTVWEYLRNNWQEWRDSFVVPNCISSDTAVEILEAFNPVLFDGDKLPIYFDDVINWCLAANQVQTVGIALKYIKAARSLEYFEYMRVVSNIVEKGGDATHDLEIWDLAQKRGAESPSEVRQYNLDANLAYNIAIKHIHEPEVLVPIVKWLANVDFMDDPEQLQLALLLYLQTDQFPQFEQAAYDYFDKWSNKSGIDMQTYVAILAIGTMGSEKAIALSDNLLARISPDSQIFKIANRSGLILFLSVFAKVGEFAFIKQLLEEMSTDYTFEEFMEDWKKQLLTPGGYPAIITPHSFRQHLLATIPAEIRLSMAPYLQQLNDFLTDSPIYMSRLAHVAASNTYILSPDFIETLAGNGKKATISKTGSGLHALLSDKLGVVVNEVPLNSLEIWQQAHDAGIPVSPIIKTGREVRVSLSDDEHFMGKRVFTRFSGCNLYEWLIQEGTPELFELVDREVKKITTQLAALQIRHGHPHLANYTVEFVEKSWYEGQLLEGKNVNTVPFEESHYSFDLRDYKNDPEKWQPIIRLIDWDRSSSSNSVGENAPLPTPLF